MDQAPQSLPGAPKLGQVNEDELSSDFTRELAKGMENLMKELGGKAGADAGGDTDEERDRALKAAWEAMLVEGLNGETAANDVGTEYKGAKDFQSTIQETMRKLKENDPTTQVRSSVSSVDAPVNDRRRATLRCSRSRHCSRISAWARTARATRRKSQAFSRK